MHGSAHMLFVWEAMKWNNVSAKRSCRSTSCAILGISSRVSLPPPVLSFIDSDDAAENAFVTAFHRIMAMDHTALSRPVPSFIVLG